MSENKTPQTTNIYKLVSVYNELCVAQNLTLHVRMINRTERVKREIQNIYRADAKKPVNIAKEYTKLYIQACRIFGSWRNALEACGLNYESARNHKKWNREKICKEITRLNKKGFSLRPSVLRQVGMTDLLSAAGYHYGSWRRAVETCGYEYSFGRDRTEANGHTNNGYTKNGYAKNSK